MLPNARGRPGFGELFGLSVSRLVALMPNKSGPVAAQRSQGHAGHQAPVFNPLLLNLGGQDCLGKKKRVSLGWN